MAPRPDPGTTRASPMSTLKTTAIATPGRPDAEPIPRPAPPTARAAAVDGPSAASDLLALTKPGITKLVALTTAVGFCLAALQRSWSLPSLAFTFVACVAGAALSAAGASALNMWMERARDGAMHRTAARPLPAGRLHARTGLLLGLALSIAGVALLWAAVNPAAAAVSAVTITTYLLLYTALKPVTTLSTLIGTVPGALPPLIGWTGAWTTTGPIGAWESLTNPGGWSLFLLMAVWQVPHFLAIGFMHREDYARAGHKVLAIGDTTGGRTAFVSLIWLLALLPVSLFPVKAIPGSLGWPYILVALIAGALFLLSGVQFALQRTRGAAKRMFLASIMHLPLLLLAMTIDALTRTLMR